jgi:type III pantothenate kinase
MNKTRVSIDIGNTRTHIGIIDMEELICINRIDIISKDSPEHILQCIDKLHRQSGTPAGSTVVISSVIESSLKKMMALFEKEKIAAIQVRYTDKLPIKIDYNNPAQLGTDRIANALYGHYRFPGENVVLISAGTALTADLLSEGKFLGGAILAGPTMQFQSLHKGTDALPEIKAEGNCRLPGNSTEECIRAGVFYGTGGALNSIIDRYKKMVHGNIRVLATGGALPLITDFLDFEYSVIPDMTLLGISLFADFF